MPRLVIVSLGQLGGTLLESIARRQTFDEIIVATRNVDYAETKANNARIGAAIEGVYPTIEVHAFDLNAPQAAQDLASFAPDVLFAAPSMMPWWQLDAVEPDSALANTLRDAPFATFMACHLAPMVRFRDAFVASGLRCPWIGASYPDVVNHLLACTGEAPTCGVGNVLEAVPKIQLVTARALGVQPAAIDVRLVAQHAFEYHCYADKRTNAQPPYLLEVFHAGDDVTELANQHLFEPYPIPYDLDFNRITTSACLPVLEGLTSTSPVHTHVPAPLGRLGGYPVTLTKDSVQLDLPSGWSEEQARTTNERSLPFDGIEEVTADGVVIFSASTADALEVLSGTRVAQMSVTDAADIAQALVARVSGGG
jgi:hypothetical protein